MTDLTCLLDALRRPRILVRAARAGLREYRRDRDLRRILRNSGGGQTLNSLIAEEARLEDVRVTGGANYSIQRHITVLTALLAESRLAAPTRQAA